MAMPRFNTQSGFTLVELVLVLLLVGILAMSALARLPQASLNVGAQADQLVGDIRYAQSLSMAQGQRFCFNLTAASYRITNTDCATNVPHPATVTATPVLLGTGMSMSWTNLPNSYVEFDGKGQPYVDTVPAAGTALAAEAVITLTKDGQSATVRVTPETGRIYR